MMSQWEKSVNALANETMASDEFSGSMNQAMAFMLRMQQTMAEKMGASLGTLNLPNREDIARIGERMQMLETRVDRIVQLLEHPGGQSKAAQSGSGPRRTKRPPAKVSGQA